MMAPGGAILASSRSSSAPRVTAMDLGGSLPRKVLLFVEDGSVRVKYLGRLGNDTIERREEEYARTLDAGFPSPEVELF